MNWNVTPSDDNAYQNNLDTTLLGQESFSDWNKFAESATTGPQDHRDSTGAVHGSVLLKEQTIQVLLRTLS